jgi:hypothetical protein
MAASPEALGSTELMVAQLAASREGLRSMELVATQLAASPKLISCTKLIIRKLMLGMQVVEQLKIIWKEDTLAYFSALSRLLAGGIDKNHEEQHQKCRCVAVDSNRAIDRNARACTNLFRSSN